MLGVGILPYDLYHSQNRWHSEITYLETISAKLTLPFKIAKLYHRGIFAFPNNYLLSFALF